MRVPIERRRSKRFFVFGNNTVRGSPLGQDMYETVRALLSLDAGPTHIASTKLVVHNNHCIGALLAVALITRETTKLQATY